MDHTSPEKNGGDLDTLESDQWSGPVDRTESESPLWCFSQFTSEKHQCRKSMILPSNSRQKPLRTVGNLPSDLESLRFFFGISIYIYILWDLIGIMHSFMAYGCLDYAYVWWITSHAMSHIQLQGLSHAIPTLSTPCTCTSSVNHVRSVSETTWQCLSRWPGDHHPSPAWRRYLAGLISYIQCWGIRFCAEILSVLRVVQTLAYTHMLPINMLQCGDPPVMFVGL